MAKGDDGLSATAEKSSGSAADLFAEIARLTERTRASRNRDAERRLLLLRHLAGISLTDRDNGSDDFAQPSFGRLPNGNQLPDFTPADLTPSSLRAAVLRDGCMIVRGLVEPDDATRLATQIDRAFDERDRQAAGGEAEPGYYERFHFQPPYKTPVRRWIEEGGGLLAVDSPMLTFELMDVFAAAGVPELVAGYLGEIPVLSADKTTFRKAEPNVIGAWHQDGAFMGHVRSINLWLSLSHCGVDAPGLDLVPRRLNSLVPTGTEGTFLPDQVSQAKAEEAAGPISIARPVFRPGDAVFFDDLCLHKTGSDSLMTKTRFAVESWFFASSAFPGAYAPIATTFDVESLERN